MVDVEVLLTSWLEANIEDIRASTWTPADLDSRLPWVLVRRTGGPYDGFRLDQPSVDVAVFAPDVDTASALALQIQRLFHESLARHQHGDAVVSHVRTTSGPHWIPYDNPAIQRYEASYTLAVHPA